MSKRNQIGTVIIIALMLFASIGVVMDVHAASVSLNKKSVTLTVGESTTLKVKGTKKAVVWNSSNSKVAKVTKKGKITAKKKDCAGDKADKQVNYLQFFRIAFNPGNILFAYGFTYKHA